MSNVKHIAKLFGGQAKFGPLRQIAPKQSRETAPKQLRKTASNPLRPKNNSTNSKKCNTSDVVAAVDIADIADADITEDVEIITSIIGDESADIALAFVEGYQEPTIHFPIGETNEENMTLYDLMSRNMDTSDEDDTCTDDECLWLSFEYSEQDILMCGKITSKSYDMTDTTIKFGEYVDRFKIKPKYIHTIEMQLGIKRSDTIKMVIDAHDPNDIIKTVINAHEPTTKDLIAIYRLLNKMYDKSFNDQLWYHVSPPISIPPIETHQQLQGEGVVLNGRDAYFGGTLFTKSQSVDIHMDVLATNVNFMLLISHGNNADYVTMSCDDRGIIRVDNEYTGSLHGYFDNGAHLRIGISENTIIFGDEFEIPCNTNDVAIRLVIGQSEGTGKYTISQM